MDVHSTLKSVGRFLVYAIIAICAVYTLTFAADVISSQATIPQMILGGIVFITIGSLLFNGVRWTFESFIESLNPNKTKENENA